MGRLIYGVGVNDAGYVVKPTIGGVRSYCPIYSKWAAMLQRCYSDYGKIKTPTYTGVSVCDQWLVFSNFMRWYEKNYTQGLHLDKDILITGNKVYGPEVCVFVPRSLNGLLAIPVTGSHPIGVSEVKDTIHKYKAQVRIGNTQRYLGLFPSSCLAHKAWQWEKANQIETVVAWYAKQHCFRTDVAEALTQRVWELRLMHNNNEQTFSL